MPSPFDITIPSNLIALSHREGTAAFTVRLIAKRNVRATAKIVTTPPDSPAAAWLTLVSPQQAPDTDPYFREFNLNETKQYQVKIAPPGNAKPGLYSFKLVIAEQINPDENFSESTVVTFTLPEPRSVRGNRLIATLVAIILLVVIAIAAAATISSNHQANVNATGTAVALANLSALANQTVTANALATEVAANQTATAAQLTAVQTAANGLIQATQVAATQTVAAAQQTHNANLVAAAWTAAQQTLVVQQTLDEVNRRETLSALATQTRVADIKTRAAILNEQHVAGLTATAIWNATLTQQFLSDLTATAAANPLQFTAVYGGLSACGGFYQAGFQITNIGGVTFHSVRFDTRGPDAASIMIVWDNSPFYSTRPSRSNCIQAGAEVLTPGASSWIFANAGTSPPPPGTPGSVVIRICSENDLAGFCNEVNVAITF